LHHVDAINQTTTNIMSNLQELNTLAQEIANSLGNIDLDLLKKVHDLVTGGNKDVAAATESDSLTAVS
jgi:hypothetical protein